MDTNEYRKLDVCVDDGECKVSVEFDRVEQEFTADNRNLVLYSNIKYITKDFNLDVVVPTVRIPYKDPALGFVLNGVNFSSVGVYQRAPGVVISKDKNPGGQTDRIDLVSSKNTTIGIVYRRNGVQLGFRKGGKERFVPVGIFLKAFSGLPYAEILKRFEFKPIALTNSFPCELLVRNSDLATVDTYGVDRYDEPSIDECVSFVWEAITHFDSSSGQTEYSTHYKHRHIQNHFMRLHFKTEQHYESTLALHTRALGTYLDQDLKLPVFKEDGSVGALEFPKGTFIDERVGAQLQWYDISCLRVKNKRSYVLQEDTPMYFRAKGYKLAVDLPELDLYAGDVLNEDHLRKLNGSDMEMLDVFTPEGRKVLTRSTTAPCFGDFCTILNCLFTASFKEQDEGTQYEVANRVILDYDRQVILEIEQVYQDIIKALSGYIPPDHLLERLPKLPSTRLEYHLRDINAKEVAQADNTNVMSRAIAERRASALMESAPKDMATVQKGQYGRIDSLHAPESDKVGSVQETTAMSRVDPKTGAIEAPYEKVVNGKPTGEIVYLSAARERNKYIAGWNDDLTSETTMARYNDDVTTVACYRVDYRDVSPFVDMSVSRMTIPFPEFSQPKRSLMATKMSGQAVPLLFPERPLVSTGADTEVPCLYYTGKDIVESSLGAGTANGGDLELIHVDWNKSSAVYTCSYAGKSFKFAVPFTATDKKSLYNFNLNFKPGHRYTMEDIVFYSQSCDIKVYDYWERVSQGSLPLITDIRKPALALGRNLKVVYKTSGSSTIEDAVVISDRVVKDQKLSNVQIFKYDYELKRNEEFCMHTGVAKPHTHVYAKEPLITVISSKKNHGTKKYVRAKQDGEVIYSEIIKGDETKAVVWVATLHDAAVGDKVAGRYGNKSVIAKIVPECDMPYDPETGETYDIVLSPLGIPSRMNLGQVLEVVLGAAMSKTGQHAVVTPFYPGIKQEIEELYSSVGLSQKRLFNPVYGKFTERPVLTGTMYFLKLEQMSNLKDSAVGCPVSVDPVFGQPIASASSDKGQKISEMETWVLEAVGARRILNAFFNLYSSDDRSRRDFFRMLEGNTDNGTVGSWDEVESDAIQYRPANINAVVTQTIIRMFGLDLIPRENSTGYSLLPLNLNDILTDTTALAVKNNNVDIVDSEWCKVRLNAPVVHPFWIKHFRLGPALGVQSLPSIAAGKHAVNVYTRETKPVNNVMDYERSSMITGMEAVIALLRNTTIDEALKYLGDALPDTQYAVDENGYSSEDSTNDDDVILMELRSVSEEVDGAANELVGTSSEFIGEIRFLRRMKEAGMNLSDLIWEYLPVLPSVLRQPQIVNGSEQDHAFQKHISHILDKSRSDDIYAALLKFIGYGKRKDDDIMDIRGYFFGKDGAAGEHGRVRSSVLSKRIGFSGRAVIVPSEDPTMPPYFIGIPWRMALIQLSKILAIRLSKRAARLSAELYEAFGHNKAILENFTFMEWEEIIESLYEFNPYIFGKHFPDLEYGDAVYLYHLLRREIKSICEDNVRNDGYVRYNNEWVKPEDLPDGAVVDVLMVMSGRQPTLHKHSIRVFFGRLVDGRSIHIHPMVCNGYNADFDGDTMWECVLLGTTKIEGWKTLSVLQNLRTDKDGSFALGITQDIVLGLYCATVFKDNTAEFTGTRGQYYLFDSLDELRMQLEYGDLHYYDPVVYVCPNTGHKYLSTAGRVLINGSIPGAMTSAPAKDSWGICAAIFGEDCVSKFCHMKYDMPWVVTGIRPEGRPTACKVEDVLLETYRNYDARTAVETAQRLYELGLIASDIYSVSTGIEDMAVDADMSEYMKAPQDRVAKLNTLEQMGLVTEAEKKSAAARAWDQAHKAATKAVVRAIPANSNTHFMMYSGARGKPAQVMQSVGFIGTVSKTKQSDIEYPILTSYGSGLSSLDLAQTRYMARIGVISTQSGTKETGYATRQTVFMSAGMTVREHDCGIEWNEIDVLYDRNSLTIIEPDGTCKPFTSLCGASVDPDAKLPRALIELLEQNGYVINEDILEELIALNLSGLQLRDRFVKITSKVDADWRRQALEEGYSYALPYTSNRKITEETIAWIEEHQLPSIIGFDRETSESDACFDQEAYLPVKYDRTKMRVTLNGESTAESLLYGKSVSSDSEKFYYYKRLLDVDNGLTLKAFNYLAKKGVRYIQFEDGSVACITYELDPLFASIVLDRSSTGLPYLSDRGTITKETLKEIERCQLEAIPVRTGFTCLTQEGVCSKCHGESISTMSLVEPGTNIGIAAAQAQCEPLQQATLDVGHSGGKRGAGVGLVSGLTYYVKLLRGKLLAEKNILQEEGFAPESGYVSVSKYDPHMYQIVDDEGNVRSSGVLDDPERLNVPDGAYIDAGDTIRMGVTRLSRYDGTDIFQCALKMRYQLMQEYYRIFAALNVSPRNYEILAREQTSIVYLDKQANMPPTKDTSAEIRDKTGCYRLMLSKQTAVVNKYTGVAAFSFENPATMLLMGATNPESLKLNSFLGNLVTGTPPGTDKAQFISKSHTGNAGYKRSALKDIEYALSSARKTNSNLLITAGDGGEEQRIALDRGNKAEVASTTQSLLADLFSINKELGGAEEPAVLQLDFGMGPIAAQTPVAQPLPEYSSTGDVAETSTIIPAVEETPKQGTDAGSILAGLNKMNLFDD